MQGGSGWLEGGVQFQPTVDLPIDHEGMKVGLDYDGMWGRAVKDLRQ
jgi:hypothetical protein